MVGHKVSAEASQKRGDGLLVELARFRYRLRMFLRFSERAARAGGVTPQQHQLLLGVAGYTGQGWATISDLAEFLQERHNAVVGLVERAVQHGLVTKRAIARDHRFVRVALTPRGRRILGRLAELHRRELTRFQGGITLSSEGEDLGPRSRKRAEETAQRRPTARRNRTARNGRNLGMRH